MSDVVTIEMSAKGKNALGTQLLERVRDQVVAAGDRPILLTGAGDSFSAGLNLKEVGSMDVAAMEVFLRLLEDTVERLLLHPAPTVAAVNGHAIAGGAVLARCCDIAIATTSPRVRIGLNEVAIGLRFPPKTFRAMAHKLPARHHAEVLLGAGLHTPEDAARLGLVDALSDDCLAEARARLAVLASYNRGAYAATKSGLLRGVTDVTDRELQDFMNAVLPTWTSDRIRAKIRAILGG